MPRFAANLSMLFTEVPFIERFERAARAGFTAVECQFPYDCPAAEIRAALDRNGLSMVLHNLPAGNWAAGERGIGCHPDRAEEFRAGVDLAIAYATPLGVKQLNCLAGIRPPQASEANANRALVENLGFAAARLKAAGIRLLIEPINTLDVPGFFLSHTKQATDIIAATGSDNIFVQYDIYHMQRMEGELAGTIEQRLAQIAHIQLADNPGRHEPGSGEINYPFIFALLDRIGYAGWIGCEYKPATVTEAGLGWVAPYLKHPSGD
jgi:hydroxypyruvate isomerase